MPRNPKAMIPEDLRGFRQAALSDQQLAEKMLARNPDLISQTSGAGETALHFCAIEGAHDAVAWLLSKGAAVDGSDRSSCTPLIHAAQLGHLETCRVLLKWGADVRAKDDIEANTALHVAARYGHVEVCRLLLNSGGSANTMNDDGNYPWDIALQRKKDLIHAVLREHGGRPGEQTQPSE